MPYSGLDALAVDRVGDAAQRPIPPWLRGFRGLHSFASTMMVIQLYPSALKREHPRMTFGDEPRSGCGICEKGSWGIGALAWRRCPKHEVNPPG